MIKSMTGFGRERMTLGSREILVEIRSVNHVQQRVSEAVRLGFTKIIVPSHNRKDITAPDGVEIVPVRDVRQAFEAICE